MDQVSGLQATSVKVASASHEHAVSRSQLHRSQGQRVFAATLDGTLVPSIVRSEQEIYLTPTFSSA